jgi:hypothetical protein
MALPPELGAGPLWEPNKKHHHGHTHPKKNFIRRKR